MAAARATGCTSGWCEATWVRCTTAGRMPVTASSSRSRSTMPSVWTGSSRTTRPLRVNAARFGPHSLEAAATMSPGRSGHTDNAAASAADALCVNTTPAAGTPSSAAICARPACSTGSASASATYAPAAASRSACAATTRNVAAEQRPAAAASRWATCAGGRCWPQARQPPSASPASRSGVQGTARASGTDSPPGPYPGRGRRNRGSLGCSIPFAQVRRCPPGRLREEVSRPGGAGHHLLGVAVGVVPARAEAAEDPEATRVKFTVLTCPAVMAAVWVAVV
jgi:hypothetical protein